MSTALARFEAAESRWPGILDYRTSLNDPGYDWRFNRVLARHIEQLEGAINQQKLDIGRLNVLLTEQRSCLEQKAILATSVAKLREKMRDVLDTGVVSASLLAAAVGI